jgi:hypothetical protein
MDNQSFHDSSIDLIFKYLETYFMDFPLNRHKDKVYFTILLDDFSGLDILNEMKLFHVWTIDNGAGLSNPRLSFRKWLMRASQWA